jgi:hypothetical protein
MNSVSISDISFESGTQRHRLGRARWITGGGLLLVGFAQGFIFLVHPEKWQWFSTGSASAATIFVDVAAGVLLVLIDRVWIGYVATALLLILMAHSFHILAQGKPSCGCLPHVPVPPWMSIIFGTVLLGGLIASFPGNGDKADINGSSGVSKEAG